MASYQPRKIKFAEIVQVNDWQVKIYTIARQGDFESPEFYRQAIAQLPTWLTMRNSFDPSHEHLAFLILHAGNEGLFSIINWWVGKNMLNTHIFITDPAVPHQFKRISGDGLAPCIWELEVIQHERKAWMKYILQSPHSPDYESYLAARYSGEI